MCATGEGAAAGPAVRSGRSDAIQPQVSKADREAHDRQPAVAHGWLFFFQAEDGIRDVAVTGVQTCALPIYPQPHTFTEVLRHRHVRLGVLAIFVYVGAEVTIGSFLISYITAARIGNLDAGSAEIGRAHV